MITAIKREQRQISAGQVDPNFQYAGMWCWYAYQGGHNCASWAEEKLGLAGVGSGYSVFDSSKTGSPAFCVVNN